MVRLFLAILTASVLLAGCQSGSSAPATKIEVRVPWGTGDTASYVIQDQKGGQLGTSEITVNKDATGFVVHQSILIGAYKDEVNVVLRADDLKPVSGHRVIDQGKGPITVDTKYVDQKLSINAKTPDGDKAADIDVPADAYDNDAALAFWRCLPYQEGYKVSYTNVTAANALKTPVTLAVLGKERVVVPAGEIEAWKVQLEAGQTKQSLWYAVAAPNHLVKYDNGSTVFLLSQIR
jgi:hypothetical protein